VLFHTRWVLSYLSGPMTREQIQRVMAARSGAEAAPRARPRPEKREATTAKSARAKPGAGRKTASADLSGERPVVPPEIDERFLPPSAQPASAAEITYRPALCAAVTLHYKDARKDVDEWQKAAFLAPLDEDTASRPWDEAEEIGRTLPALERKPIDGAAFASLPAAAVREKSYARWQTMLETHAYKERPLRLFRCAALKLVSKPGETEGDVRARVRELARERRDLELEKLRKKYAPKLAQLQDRIRMAEERVAREKDQYEGQKIDGDLARLDRSRCAVRA
jgi:hypothetical protein